MTVLAIDFGTSFSSAATFNGDAVDLVLDGGEPWTPSAVYLGRDGEILVGKDATRRGLADPSGYITGLKRLLGRSADDPSLRSLDAGVGYKIVDGPGGNTMVRAHGIDRAPVQLAAAVLAKLRRLAELRYGGAIRQAVMTVPVEHGPRYTSALRRAASVAGLDVVGVVPEPVAGALTRGLDRPGDRRLAVCDFGGGTFDATLIEQHGAHFRAVACAGDGFLGGEDFDLALADGVDGTIFRGARTSLRKDVVVWSNLVHRCESVKRQLSSSSEARLHLRDAYTREGQRIDLDLLIERSWIEGKWLPLAERAAQVVVGLLAQAAWGVEMVDEVMLIGGTSLVPLVQRVLGRVFGRRLVAEPSATVAVVCGAALVAPRYAGLRQVSPVELV